MTGILVVEATDGKTAVVSIGADAMLRTWDLATAEPTGVYPVGTATHLAARAVRLDRHRLVIVVLAEDGLLHLWDLATAELLRTVPVVPAWRRRLAAFTPLHLTLDCLTVPGGRHFAFVGGEERGTSVWELPSGQQVAVLPSADPAEIGYLEMAGGRVVLVAQTDVAEHWVFDAAELRELPVDSGRGRRSPLGAVREALGTGTHVRFYASARGEPAVAVRYSGRSAVVWDLAADRALGSWPASEPGVPVRLAGGEQVTVPLRLRKEEAPDLRGSGLQQLGSPRRTRASQQEAGRLTATPTGRFLRVRFRDGATGAAGSVMLAGHTGDVTAYDSVRVPDEGYVVVTASLDGTVRRWDIDVRAARRAGGDDGGASGRAVPAVTRVVGAGLIDGASAGLAIDARGDVALWDLRTGEYIRDIYAPMTSAAAVGRLGGEPVAIMPSGWAVGVLRLPDGTTQYMYGGGRLWWPNAVASVPLPDGSEVAVTTGHGRKAVVWDLDAGLLSRATWDPRASRMRRVLAGHRGWTSCVARVPGPGGRPFVLTGGFDNRVNVWDVGRGWHRRFRIVEPLTFLTHPSAGHARAVSALRLPDGRMLVLVVTLDGIVRALETTGTMARGRRTGAAMAEVVASATLTSGLLVVITAADGVVRAWDAAAFPPASGTAALCEINTEAPVTDIGVTDHDMVVLATPNGLTAIRLDAGALAGQAAQPIIAS